MKSMIRRYHNKRTNGIMKEGDFTDQDIDQTKAVIQNQFLETVDSARGLIEVLYHNVVPSHMFNLKIG